MARANWESAAPVMIGLLAWTVLARAVAVPGPVGGDEWVRAWLMRSRCDTRSCSAYGCDPSGKAPFGRPTVCARPCVGWKEVEEGVECVVMWLGADIEAGIGACMDAARPCRSGDDSLDEDSAWTASLGFGAC